MHYLRLVRWPNLLIIAFSQALIRYGIILPFMGEPAMSLGLFIALLFSTVLVAAGGYVINDYLDTAVDKINKPNKVIVGRHIKPAKAINFYYLLTILGVGIGLWLGYTLGNFKLGLIPLISAALLWVYAHNLKQTPFIGNLVIALLSGLVLLTEGLFDIMPAVTEENAALSKAILKIVLMYTGFGFLVSLIRELIKDLEDLPGDKKANYNTLPIAIGINNTKAVIILLFLSLLSGLWYLIDQQVKWTYINTYILIAIIIPTLAAIGLTFKANKPKAYHTISIVLKIIMLTGLLLIIVLGLDIIQSYYTPPDAPQVTPQINLSTSF